MPPPQLPGAMPKGSISFMGPDGRPSERTSGIVAFMKQYPEKPDELEFIGTAFFIGADGIFVTARHVAEAVPPGPAGGKSPYGAYLLHLMPNNQSLLQPVLSLSLSKTSDVAAGLAAPMSDPDTGERFWPQVLRLRGLPSRVGETVRTWAFPKTVVEHPAGKTHVHLNPDFFEGKVIEHYPTGRDRAVMPWPCFQTDMHLHSGASGGPTTDAAGAVIGINSSSFDPHTDTSFAVEVSELFPLTVGPITHEGVARNFTIGGLIGMDRVHLAEFDDATQRMAKAQIAPTVR